MTPKNYEIEDLRINAQRLYPQENGIETPTADVSEPKISREDLAKSLANHKQAKRLGVIAFTNNSARISEPSDNPENYNIKKNPVDFPSMQDEEPSRYFVGPVLLNGEYCPNGIGVYEVLPANAEEE